MFRSVRQFASIADAKTKIEAWRLDYNQRRRPHGLARPTTPSEFVAQRQAGRPPPKWRRSSYELSRYGANVTPRSSLSLRGVYLTWKLTAKTSRFLFETGFVMGPTSKTSPFPVERCLVMGPTLGEGRVSFVWYGSGDDFIIFAQTRDAT